MICANRRQVIIVVRLLQIVPRHLIIVLFHFYGLVILLRHELLLEFLTRLLHF